MKSRHLLVTISILAALLSILSCSRAIQTETDPVLYGNHKPYTRWWWFSSEIDKSEVRDQLIWLRDHEFGGVEIAWVYPMLLAKDTPHPDFLSEQWSEPVIYAKKVADSLGLGCDFTYGTLWPFSDVDLPAGDGTRTWFDTVEVARRPYTWDHPKEARILNHLDKEAFYRYAEKMNKGLRKAYAGSPSGLFVDSWEVETEYLWTKGFGETFQKEHGYAIEPFMEARTLYDEENSDVRYDYMKTMSGYVLREFYGPFAENARREGAFSRAQCGGAPTDLLTAFTLVDIPETDAILYEPCFSRIVASAAALGGKQAVTSETFTCMYGWTGLRYKDGYGHSPHQGEEQIADLKLVCDALFANGTNQIIWHGFPYNGIGNKDHWFYTTCQVSTSDEDNLTGDALTSFNHYMTDVSGYMRKGRTYSDLAVYIPTEDAWMGGAYPEEVTSKMAWALGEYEMRYVETPEAFKGMNPLWVNGHFLESAQYRDGALYCGDEAFRALYVDVEYMDHSSLESILSLARSGLPVCMARRPSEPGKVKHGNYGKLLDELYAQPSVSAEPSTISTKRLIEGDNIPDFWCREDGDDLYIFLANPYTDIVTYPMEYGCAFKDEGSVRQVTVNHHGKSEGFTLEFKPMESILLKVSPDGISQVDLGYVPPVLLGYND